MARTIGGIVGGLVAGIVVMLVIALVAGLLFPLSSEVDARDPEQIKAVFAASPIAAKFAVFLSWFCGALSGALTAKYVSKRSWTAWFIAGLFAVYVLMNVFILPMPAWMQILAVAAPVLAGVITNHIVFRTRTDDDAEFAPEEEPVVEV